VVKEVVEDQPENLRPVGVMEVARAAGVSGMTVSRVANGRPGVGPETRKRVLEVMKDMGFLLNHSARALRVGRTATLGVVCISSNFYGPAQVLFGVEQAAREEGYATIIVTLDGTDRAALDSAVNRLRRSSVEAIVVISPLVRSAEALRHMGSDLPILAIWAPSDVGLVVTGMNHFAASAAATQHLLDLGHHTVWHISGPLEWTGSEQRMAGWRATLEAAGITPPPVLEGDWTAQSGYSAGMTLLRETDATAVFAANDQMALGLYRAAHEVGRRVPEELSVVGYDDGPDSAFYTPPLTTVHQDFVALGVRAFETIESIMQGGAPAESLAPDAIPLLVVRESSAPPPRI
jgi:DNA-binding LacI/PurR family transcriptional regulator